MRPTASARPGFQHRAEGAEATLPGKLPSSLTRLHIQGVPPGDDAGIDEEIFRSPFARMAEEEFSQQRYIDWQKIGAAVHAARRSGSRRGGHTMPRGGGVPRMGGGVQQCPEEDFAIEAAARLKEEGNAAFGRGHFTEALDHFSSALVLCRPAVEDPQLPPQLVCLLLQLQLGLYNNRALVHLKLRSFVQATCDANAVLQIEPANAKALFRRAMAER
jgi:hypothetical protein